MAVAENLGRAAQIEPVGQRPEAQLAEDLFTEHSRLVYAYCLRHLRSPEEAEDAVQATYLNACRTLMRGFEPDVAQAWLLKVAQNVCLTRIRSRSRRARLELAQDLSAVEDRLPAHEVGDELFGIEDALAGLPEQQRRAILLREWQGLSYREVAAHLGLTQSAVEALIFRARRALAAALEEPKDRRRPRFMHSLDLGAAFAALKSGLSASMSSSLATSVAVAASATAIASTPVVLGGADPLALEPAPAAVEKALEAPGQVDPPVRFSTGSARGEHLGLAGRAGPPAWAGRPDGKGRPAPSLEAKGKGGKKGDRPTPRAHGMPTGAGGGPPAWAGSGRSGQGGQGSGSGRGKG